MKSSGMLSLLELKDNLAVLVGRPMVLDCYNDFFTSYDNDCPRFAYVIVYT